MDASIARRIRARLPFDLQPALSHCNKRIADCRRGDAIISGCQSATRACWSPKRDKTARSTGPDSLATERELSDFLKSVEKRAFKRSVYHVRDEEAALDIVQDSMMKLAEHYGDKPPNELPMLFQRILSNCTLDYFRRQKTRNALFSNMSDFESASDDGDFDLLETYASSDSSQQVESAEDSTRRAQVLREIEAEIQELPGRQREAFLMRYWEDMDVAETAAAMGCSEGSVKTHCSRAVQALSKALKAKGIQL
jgi:RNA polymerase sigma-70 factor (ECF subfamily)